MGFVLWATLSLAKVPSFKLRCCLAQWQRPLQFRWSISFVNEKSLVPAEESFCTRRKLRVFYVWLRHLRVESIT